MKHILDQNSFINNIKNMINRAILNNLILKQISKDESTIEIVSEINDYLNELINKKEINNTLEFNLIFIKNCINENKKISNLNKKLFEQNINKILKELNEIK